MAKIYDRGEYWAERVDAAQRWADHVEALITDPKPKARKPELRVVAG